MIFINPVESVESKPPSTFILDKSLLYNDEEANEVSYTDFSEKILALSKACDLGQVIILEERKETLESHPPSLEEVINYWYLLLAVLIGGQIGNFLNLKIFPTRALALVTAFLVLFVALRMGVRLFASA